MPDLAQGGRPITACPNNGLHLRPCENPGVPDRNAAAMLREGVCSACPRRDGASRPCRPCCAMPSSAPSCPRATWPRRWPAARPSIGARATCAARKLSMRSRPSPRRHTRIDTTIHTTTTPARGNPAARRRAAPPSTSPRRTRVVPGPGRALPRRAHALSIRCSMAIASRPVRCAGCRRRGASGGARRRARRQSDTQGLFGPGPAVPASISSARCVAALTLFRIPRSGGPRPRAAIALGASLRRPP